MEFNKQQKEVMAAFGDAFKAERTEFITQALHHINANNVILDVVSKAFESVNHLDGEEADQLKSYISAQMMEYTRRGLQRAVKGMVKEAESHE